MICLSCKHLITDDLTYCPYCHVQLNAEKLRFIKYIGEADSLVGYQKSYKLILLRTIFEYINLGQELSVDSIMYKIKDFYLNRVHNGLSPDYDVNDRIQNISESTSIYEIWAVFKTNPYNVINNQGFLFLEKNSSGELIFVLPDDIMLALTKIECENIIDLLNKKLALYYSKYENDGKKINNEQEPSSHDQDSCIATDEKQDAGISDIDILIEHTPLSTRAKNCLLRSGYKYFKDILDMTEDALYSIRNIGYRTVQEIQDLILNYKNGNIKLHNIISTGNSDGTNLLDISDRIIDPTALCCALDDTDLSVRAKNVLTRAGYKLVEDIVELTEEELIAYRNLGYITLHEILDFIKSVRIANGLQKVADESDDGGLTQLIKHTELGTRAQNALTQAGYRVVGDMLEITEPQLRQLPGLGEGTVEEILSFVISLKMKLANEAPYAEQNSFELIKYPYINISAECEQIPVTVLSYFGVPNIILRKLQGNGIYKLEQLKKLDYAQIKLAMGDDWIKLLHFTLEEFYDGAVSATKYFLDNIYKEEDLSFIVERSRGATLQEIGNKHGMTREGVRGKIEKPLKAIKPMAVCLITSIINRSQSQFITLQDVYDIYDNDEYDAIIYYALKESEEIEAIESLGLFFLKTQVSYNESLCVAIKEYVGEGVLWYRHVEQLLEILQEKNIAFVDLDDIWLYMLSIGYKVYGEYVAPHTVSYGVLLGIIVDEEFPNGIYLSDVNAIAQLRRRAKERFGNLNLPEEDRALVARVSDSLVICDRGKCISPNRVAIDVATLDVIKEYIDNSQNDIIYYQALFNQFEGLLAMTSDIQNYHYLHGVLKLYYYSEYTFARDYLQKSDGGSKGSLSNRIYDYIIQKERAVSRDELKAHLSITSDSMIFNAINADNRMFQWEFNYYNCLGNIRTTPHEEDLLRDMVEEIFSENQNYGSAKLLYERSMNYMPDMLERNRVINSTNMFYLACVYIGNKYHFRFPHILPQDSKLSNTEEIAKKFVGTPDIIRWDEFSSMSDRYGWGYGTGLMIFNNIIKDGYCRISPQKYIRKEKLSISTQQISQISELMDKSFVNSQYFGTWTINYGMLPNIGYEWTPHLLQAIVSLYLKQYRLITPYYGAKKVERGLYVQSSSDFQTYDDIVISAIMSSGRTSVTENELYTLLVIAGIIKNTLPNELKESKRLSYKDGVFTVKESA